MDNPEEEEKKPKWLNLTFDSQIFSSFMACPREMNYKFNQHLVPIGGVSKGIEKGTLAHVGLQVYYEAMKDGTDFSIRKIMGINAIKERAPTMDRLEGEDIVDVVNTFEEYCEFRKNDIFQVVFTEKVFKLIVYEEFPLRVIITGRIDLGINEPQFEGITPIDHKSESEHWFYSSLSNQFKFYAIACNSNRLIVNRFGFQKTVKAEKKFKRDELSFEQDVIEEFKQEVIPYYARAMIVAMNENYFPPNYTNCIKGHFACIFSDKYSGGICTIDRSLRQPKLNTYFQIKEWDPSFDETKPNG